MINRDFSGDSIFFAELDDDYQELAGLSEAELQSRLVCYYLIAPRIILHPAYIWQSQAAHRLLASTGKELLRPPYTDLELGLHDGIDSYMHQRISQLRRAGVPVTRELTSYEAHGDELFSEAKTMNLRFGPARRRDVPSQRRDHYFRGQIGADLNELSLNNSSLAQHLKTVSVGQDGALEETKLGARLKDFIDSADLVSVDTFLAELAQQGQGQLAHDPRIRKRLLALYYRTYSDRDTMIPGTRKLMPGSVVNCYDSEVFWASTQAIFGLGFARFANPDNDETLRALRDIRESSDWVVFQAAYFGTLNAVERSLQNQPESMIAKLSELHPGTSRAYVLQSLWEGRKISLLNAALSALGTIGIAFQTPLATVVSIAALGGAVLSGKSLREAMKKFAAEYQSLEMVKVRATVQLHVDRTLRSITEYRELS